MNRVIILLVLATFSQCEEPNPGFGGGASISGRTYVHDPSQQKIYAVESQIVLSSNDRFNTVLNLTTDSAGYFGINNLVQGDYRVSFKYLIEPHDGLNEVTFEKDVTVSLDANDEIELDSTVLKLNPVGVLLIDIKDNHGNAQPNFNFCLFASKTAFDNNPNCEGSAIQSRVNSIGRGIISGLITGNTYYIHALDSLGAIRVSGRDSITINADETSEKTIVVH